MAFKEPRPEALRGVLVSTWVPRPIADQLQALAEAKQCSLSKILRETVLERFSPDRRDDRSE